MKVTNDTRAQQQLREINRAGSIATKTKITLDSAEKNAKESMQQLMKPSKFVQKMASAFNKLNIF
ncbi:hypothetical protein BIY24_01220 [Halobacteriovorax marinus]|uniref:Uncharacterized protein n=1 Tax=Halobacteriovorax marinus (strain ATCC BAA-682 / DSM 15412 / SJ) TaxID=862908 RepID=E1X2X8_HALMS|nr:hypothetical protein [Halobacteriovorax marinus]ATH06601.1 hypothetical protein BIY24_01220 [Halobacteriovorax marinus]CBW25173.1 hypothetical protein BMS_0242 [Halobacteriovorax marinus SJ]